jgi:hypothetical protein
MGEFTQNLLKLTEFPFSYSLIGLLALIFGQGINVEELSFSNLGPLLILMGFVATTLSICDPVGALQRAILIGKREIMEVGMRANNLLSVYILGKSISPNIFPPPYLFAIAYTPERLKKLELVGEKINWDTVEQLSNFSQSFSPPAPPTRVIGDRTYRAEGVTKTSVIRLRRDPDEYFEELEKFEEELDKIGEYPVADIKNLMDGLKEQAVKTKWITAEVDRITALVYFIITISVFIAAILIIPDLLSKFAESFGNLGSTRTGILIFSFIALIGVVIMLILKIRGLQAKTLIVFKYLTALGAIKTAKEKFKETLGDIERYLNDSHWTLADYWMTRIQIDYTETFLEEVRK